MCKSFMHKANNGIYKTKKAKKIIDINDNQKVATRQSPLLPSEPSKNHTSFLYLYSKSIILSEYYYAFWLELVIFGHKLPLIFMFFIFSYKVCISSFTVLFCLSL